MSWFPQFMMVLFLFALAILGALWMAAFVVRGGWQLGALSWRWLRRYEVELVVNQSLVYGSSVACLAVMYLGCVAALQALLSPVTQGSDLAVAASTAAAVALFAPLRRRVRDVVDRRFYRRRYDAQKALDAFSSRLREEVGLEALRHGLQAAVQETVQPASMSLWLRPTRRRHLP